MTTPSELLLNHFDIITSAQDEKKSGRGRTSRNSSSVYGIEKLRELILELAVRGKLVPQDLNDEPASELLNRILADNRKNHVSSINEEEKRFEAPKGWNWVRFGDLYQFEYGDNLPARKRSESGEYAVYGSNGVVGTHNTCFVKKPCIVIGRKGSAGALNLCRESGCCVTDVAYFCIPPKEMDIDFSFKLFHTLNLNSLGKGIKPGLNRNEVYQLYICIPPIKEQRRIVSKIDTLIDLCDQIESQENNSNEAHEKLVNHLLNALTQSKNSDDFFDNWNRISNHFDTLFTTEESIEALKKTILQLAVMGKLVPQNLNDLTYKHMRDLSSKAEKQCGLTFKIPDNWILCKLGQIAEIVRGGSPRPAGDPRYYGGLIPFLKVGDLTGYEDIYLNKHTHSITEAGLHKTRYVEANTLMLTNSGATLGIPRICTFSTTFNDGIAAFLNIKHVDKIYLYYFLKSKTAWFLNEASRGQGQPNLNIDIISSTTLPLPPLEEQNRIIAKVNELMKICNNLKACITKTAIHQKKIADAIISRAIA